MHATSSSCNKVIYTETEIASRFTFSLLVLFVSFVYTLTRENLLNICAAMRIKTVTILMSHDLTAHRSSYSSATTVSVQNVLNIAATLLEKMLFCRH